MSGGEPRERELKLGIADAKAFDALVDVAGGTRAPAVSQVNHFFDTPGARLRENRIGFRVREEGAAMILTLKGPTGTEAGGVLSDRVELESEIEADVAHAALRGEAPALSLLDALDPDACAATGLADTVRRLCADAAPVHIGSFGNDRTRVTTELAGATVVLEFDRTQFPEGEERFEVELEITADQDAQTFADALEALFARVGISPVPTTSKLAHFLEILDRTRA